MELVTGLFGALRHASQLSNWLHVKHLQFNWWWKSHAVVFLVLCAGVVESYIKRGLGLDNFGESLVQFLTIIKGHFGLCLVF